MFFFSFSVLSSRQTATAGGRKVHRVASRLVIIILSSAAVKNELQKQNERKSNCNL